MVPPKLLPSTPALDKDVPSSARGDRLEVWDRKAWADYNDDARRPRSRDIIGPPRWPTCLT